MGVDFGHMHAGHFIFIPAVLLVGIVVGSYLAGGRRPASRLRSCSARRNRRHSVHT